MDIDRGSSPKPPATPRDWVAALALTGILHLLVVVTAALPPGNYFFPFVGEIRQDGGLVAESENAVPDPGWEDQDVSSSPSSEGPRVSAIDADPYREGLRRQGERARGGEAMVAGVQGGVSRLAVKAGFRSLHQEGPTPRLLPPVMSTSTIPPRPDKSLLQEVADDAETVLLGNVFQDAVPLRGGAASVLAGEAEFLRRLREDIADGRLDMGFAEFILAAEYYHLAHALLPLGQQPAFTLDEAMARYRQRLATVALGMPKELDAYWLVMLLQRYSDNKFYPGNGSGMLLDGLYHQQNDCEGGTKEVLAYLQSLYPDLPLGTNRGILRTTTGEFIAHMQGYIGPGAPSAKILDNSQGLIIETTRIGPESVVPYRSGEIFPLEDFVVRYYPHLVVGTPLEALLGSGGDSPGRPGDGQIVGTSDHPLKMGYGGSSVLLADQLYDLDAIRTQRIANEFQRSKVPSCNPRIDPGKIDRANLFSNFVTIDRKLRKALIGHYLADLPYWENEIMPQWRKPRFLPTYDDLVGSLAGGDDSGGGYLQVDGDNTVPVAALSSHGQFLRLLAETEKNDDASFYGSGGQSCQERSVLDEALLGYLFTSPQGPGLFFLPEPEQGRQWLRVVRDIRNHCLAVSRSAASRELVAALEAEAAGGQSSLRRELYRQVRLRGTGLADSAEAAAYEGVLEALLTGAGDGEGRQLLAERRSPESSEAEPSVAETLARSGRSGLAASLLLDGFDFLGLARFAGLLGAYGERGDLQLSVARAQELVAVLLETLGEVAGAEVLAGWRDRGLDRELQLAAAMELARLAGQSPAAVSRLAALDLENRQRFRARPLLDLLRYGLLPEDARRLTAAWSTRLLERLPRLSNPPPSADHPALFVDIAEVVKVVAVLGDVEVAAALRQRLVADLLGDFSTRPPAAAALVDYGLLFNKLAVLILLGEKFGPEEQSLPSSWWPTYLAFAAERPVGKLMLAPLLAMSGEKPTAEAIATVIAAQSSALDRLRVPGGQRAASLNEARNLLGVGNVVARLLPLLDPALHRNLAERFGGDIQRGSWYLERLHRRIAPILAAYGAGAEPLSTVADPLLEFYRDDRVRESFALLAYFQEGGLEVRFRRSQDLAAIKNPEAIKVIEGERRITRQDMSLLTLALNPGNTPEAMRRAWEETLAVTGRHQGLAPLDQGMRRYLFAPHYPYLIENDSGFFFSPETVADLHNAEGWGGRNDILLSSYLHFRHLPERLPNWLARTAKARSEWELETLKKFEQQTFLPMILECDSDSRELPEGLFRAKWEIRKPFGEDIFPGTLLLLRLGYLEITAAGDIVRTAKYSGG